MFVEFGAVYKSVKLVDLEKSSEVSIWSETSVSIQPRTRPPKVFSLRCEGRTPEIGVWAGLQCHSGVTYPLQNAILCVADLRETLLLSRIYYHTMRNSIASNLLP